MALYDLDHYARNARTVADALPALGLKVPTELATSLRLLTEAPAFLGGGIDGEYFRGVEDVDVDGLIAKAKTVEDVADAIEEYASQLRRKADLKAASPLITDRLQRRVQRALHACGGKLIADMGPIFDTAADEFTATLPSLPTGLTADDVLDAGQDAFEAFGRAKVAKSKMDLLAGLREAMAQSGIHATAASGWLEHNSRFVRAESKHWLDVKVDDHTTALSPWIDLIGLRDVIGLKWNNLIEQAEMLNRLNEAAVKDPKPAETVMVLTGF